MLAGNERAPFDFILGCWMRRQREVNDDVLGKVGRFHKVADNRKVEEVWVDDRRYVVSNNSEEAAKDTVVREPIVE